MNPFHYHRAESIDEALSLQDQNPNTHYLGGGTNLLDLMKEGLAKPQNLVDVSELTTTILETDDGGLLLGGAVKNADTANHPKIRQNYPLLSKAILAGATFQIRNMASNAGNLMQRTRCPYFYETASPCNKRNPNSGCSAREGFHRQASLFGWSDHCVATYPGDMANALLCLDAKIHLKARDHSLRVVSVEAFHRLPGDRPEQDNILKTGELIIAIELPPSSFSKHYEYIKVRERSSYAFALVSAAVGLEIREEKIKAARLTLGAVAHKPWRAVEAEIFLLGQRPEASVFERAAQLAVRNAEPLPQTKTKVRLAENALKRALQNAASRGAQA